MVISAVLERFVPRNIGIRIANYVVANSSNLSQVFHRQISTDGASKVLYKELAAPARQFHIHRAPSSFHHCTFSTGSNLVWRQKINSGAQTVLNKGVVHSKRDFSTFIDSWREKINAIPDMLKITQYDLYPKQLNALISLIEKEGVIVDRISLPTKGLNKEFITNLLLAIKKWQPILPGITAENINADAYPSRIYFQADLSHARGTERLMNQGHQLIGKYQMQRIPLKEKSFIEQFSVHIMNMSSGNQVVLTLRDDPHLLIAPPIDPVTSQPDLKPFMIVPPHFFS